MPLSVRRKTCRALRLATVIGLPLSWWLALQFFRPGAELINAHGYYLGQDFVNLWTAGRLTLAGRVAEIYDFSAYNAAIQAWLPPAYGFLNFSYPPHVLPLIAPLGALPYLAALALWQVAGVAAFTALTLVAMPKQDRRALVLFILLSPIVLLVVTTGQSSFVLALLFVGGLRLLPRRPLLAGLLFGILTVKPQLGLLLPPALILMREWRAFATAAATACALAALSVALFGPGPWHDYVAVTLPFQNRVMTEFSGIIPLMMVTPYGALWQMRAPVGPALAVHAAIAVAIAAAALYSARASVDAALRNAVLATAAVLVTPYCLSYDLAVPLAAIVIWLSEARAPHPATLAVIALLWGSAYVGMFSALFYVPVVAAATLAVFVMLLVEERRAKIIDSAAAL